MKGITTININVKVKNIENIIFGIAIIFVTTAFILLIDTSFHNTIEVGKSHQFVKNKCMVINDKCIYK